MGFATGKTVLDVECPRKDCKAGIGKRCRNRPRWSHLSRYRRFLKDMGLTDVDIDFCLKSIRGEPTYPRG